VIPHRFKNRSCIGTLVIAGSFLIGCPAHAGALSTPAMAASIAANPNPVSFDAGLLGMIYVNGNVSGFANWQDNTYRVPGSYDDRNFRWDISNAQVFIQKTDGLVQFYLQAGEYNILSLGSPFFSTRYYTADTYSPLPVAYLKLAPSDAFSIEIGKLPTLIGLEDTFDFENLNIERGLVWNFQEPAVSRGIQANYTSGAIALNLSWNDGFYSDKLDWISGLLTWTIDSANALTLAGGSSIAGDLPAAPSTYPYITVTPPTQQNSSVYNIMYTYSNAPFTIYPYLQYSNVPKDPKVLIPGAAGSWAGAVLADYTIAPNWSLAGRLEYMSTFGKSANLLFGPGSKAWSFTLTPTFQRGVFYARAEMSYVTAAHTTSLDTGFGLDATEANQLRGLLETGVQF
jgi:hypothetical protein